MNKITGWLKCKSFCFVLFFLWFCPFFSLCFVSGVLARLLSRWLFWVAGAAERGLPSLAPKTTMSLLMTLSVDGWWCWRPGGLTLVLRCVVACPTIFSTVRCSSTTGFIIAMPFLSRLLRLLLLLCFFFFVSLFSRIATIPWCSPSFSQAHLNLSKSYTRDSSKSARFCI